MFAKGILVLCASALFAQSALSQCLGRSGSNWGYDGLAYDGLGYPGAWNGRLGCGCGGIAPAVELAASYGGGLGVSSSSCAAPTGLAVTSENMYEGPVAVAGNLPFLGTAGVEGVFPTAGGSVISYGCGDGVVAITAEGPFEGAYGAAAITPAAIAPAAIAPAAIAPAMAPWGYAGVPSRGCGCGASYPY